MVKTQNVRIVDVFLLGPFMVWFGVAAKDMPRVARAFMVVAGVGTSVYNGLNYLEKKE